MDEYTECDEVADSILAGHPEDRAKITSMETARVIARKYLVNETQVVIDNVAESLWTMAKTTR